KATLEADIKKAQELLDIRTTTEAEQARQTAARQAVNELFTNNNPTANTIKGTTTQASINAAKALVDKVTDSRVKATLEADIKKAQELLDVRTTAEAEQARQTAARQAVNELFTNNNPTANTIKGTTTQASINAAKALVDKVTDSRVKATLEADIKKAQELLNAREAEQARQTAARKAVNELFENNDPTKNIKATTDQTMVDAAQKLVDKVTDTTAREQLQKDIKRANDHLEIYREAAIAKTVLDLFKDGNPSTNAIKDTTNQTAINQAQELVNTLKNTAPKKSLQELLDKAQELLDEQLATIEKPEVNPVTNNDTVVTGSGKSGLTVTVSNGRDTYTGTVTANGTFSIAIPQQKADTILTVTQKNATTSSETVSVKVTNFMPAEKVKINPVGPFQQAITGKAPEGTKSVRLLVNGVPQRLVTPEADGSFNFYSRFITDGKDTNLRLKTGDVVAVDYGIRTPGHLVATTVVSAEHVKPVVHDIKENVDYITGLAPIGTQVLRLVVNGVPQRTITPQTDINATTAGGIGPDGKFKIYSRFIKDEEGITRKLKEGDVVTIDAGVQIPGYTGTTVTVGK
ncbi:toxin Cry1Ac domain D-VI-related protein, partial [Listeria booriae]|uniref:toxin Cry1Ac domain D-VI-related protein n=1 Tax=Listeria booriae TaxID=1552123 RepID=UPI00181DEB1F